MKIRLARLPSALFVPGAQAANNSLLDGTYRATVVQVCAESAASFTAEPELAVNDAGGAWTYIETMRVTSVYNGRGGVTHSYSGTTIVQDYHPNTAQPITSFNGTCTGSYVAQNNRSFVLKSGSTCNATITSGANAGETTSVTTTQDIAGQMSMSRDSLVLTVDTPVEQLLTFNGSMKQYRRFCTLSHSAAKVRGN
jgi:hypothetical protein